ncbi:interferon regulatory factor 9-like isoform X3 [Lissotriton helveticus]
MAANFVRSTRKLKPWMIEQVDSGKYPGLTWIDPDHTCFRIPWKHGGKQDFRHHEDAAIFKAWAIYKNKYKDEDKMEAAIWKTRLRCTLNKSPKFAEVPDRSQLDISEPYKVYRLVPPGEQRVKEASNSRKRKVKEETKDVSSEDEVKPKRTSILVCMEAEAEVESVPTVSSSLYLEDSGIGSASSSPQGGSGSPQNVPDSPQRSPDSQLEITLNLVATEAADTTLVLEEGINAMRVTIFYGAHRMLQKDILSGDCKISSAQPALVASQMERIYLPPATTIQDPVRQQPTQELLTFLKKGLMLASTPQGIFAQRFCQGRVFWTGPCSPQSGMSNKLEKGACVKIFDTNRFLNDLDLYQSCQGPKPKYQVIICFGEEISEHDRKEDKLITVQLSQMLALQQLTQEVSEAFSNSITLVSNPESEELLFPSTDEHVLLSLA